MHFIKETQNRMDKYGRANNIVGWKTDKIVCHFWISLNLL